MPCRNGCGVLVKVQRNEDGTPRKVRVPGSDETFSYGKCMMSYCGVEWRIEPGTEEDSVPTVVEFAFVCTDCFTELEVDVNDPSVFDLKEGSYCGGPRNPLKCQGCGKEWAISNFRTLDIDRVMGGHRGGGMVGGNAY